jgi:ribose transport system permease protein
MTRKVGNYLLQSKYAISVIVLALVMLAATFLSSSFLTGDNLITVLRQASVLFILSSGLTAVVITGGIDLSVNNTAALVGCTVAQLLLMNVPIPLVVVIGLLVGLAVGVLNGILVGVLRLPPFVATYGTNLLVSGISVIVMQGKVIYDLPRNFTPIGVGYVGIIPVPVIIALVLVAALYFLLQKTTLGRNIYMLGSNPYAAKYSAMKNVLVTVQAYVICGLTAAIGGIVLTARLNAADANMGNSYGLQIVAAVVMGGTSLLGGEGGIFGTVIGALVLTIIMNVINVVGVSSDLQSMAVGIVIILMVWLDIFTRSKREKLSR